MIQLPQEDKRLSEVGEGALVSLRFDLGLCCEVFSSVLGGRMFLFWLVGGFPLHQKQKRRKPQTNEAPECWIFHRGNLKDFTSLALL